MRSELVTTLKRQATRILADLRESKDPILITEHGVPSAYLVDEETVFILHVMRPEQLLRRFLFNERRTSE